MPVWSGSGVPAPENIQRVSAQRHRYELLAALKRPQPKAEVRAEPVAQVPPASLPPIPALSDLGKQPPPVGLPLLPIPVVPDADKPARPPAEFPPIVIPKLDKN